jgi:hypothetical protein
LAFPARSGRKRLFAWGGHRGSSGRRREGEARIGRVIVRVARENIARRLPGTDRRGRRWLHSPRRRRIWLATRAHADRRHASGHDLRVNTLVAVLLLLLL